MQNLLNDNLKATLQADPRCIVNGELNKVKVEELALEMDSGLLKLLLADPALKKHFFAQVDDIQVFDKIKFQRFINNKSFLPDSYTAYKNKIGLTDDNGNFISESKEVVLSWPHKDCVLEGGQDKEDAKRDEIFFNEILAPDQIDHLLEPKVLTNFKKYDAKGEHDVSGITYDDNLLIKGNNLLALHSLEKVYAGKVKLIYIDPPYNTANDSFRYNDRFDHSTWLTYMRNRLEIAKRLLHPQGVIFVHLDFNEIHYCKVLMDDIFGRDSFINEIIWRRKQATSYGSSKFGITNDTILFYCKGEDYDFYPSYSKDDENTKKYIKERFIFDDGDGRKYMKSPLVNSLYRPNLRYPFQGINPPKNGWLYSKERMEEFYKNGELLIPDDPNARIYRKIFLDSYKGQVIQNIWTDIPIVNPMAKEQTDFTTQKPEKLLERIITSTTKEGDIILDYQLGSGTTCAVAHKLGRRYIGIEQMDYLNTITLPRMTKVIDGDQSGISKEANWQGGGSFIYCELAKCNQNFIDQVMDAKDDKALIALLDTIKDIGFISYKVDKDKFDGFEALSFDYKKKFLIELLDKNMLYVNLSEIEDKDHGITDKDIQLNRLFYSLEKQQQAFAE